MASDKRTEVNNLQGDIWTGDDDILLAETVLRKVREGKTVMDACREVEEVTEGRRTASASKFRWFTRLVDQYKAGYEVAKSEGAKVKAAKKRKLNKGERFEEIIHDVFNEAGPVIDKEIEPEDFIILAKKFKQQQQEKEDKLKKLDKEVRGDQKRIAELEKKLKIAQEDANWYNEQLLAKQRDYNKVIEALQTLKGLGIQIQIPEPESTKYIVDKNGVVNKKD